MGRFLRTLRTDWPRLLVELFVVVAGITISFALDEWRKEREDRREERRTWTAIQENLSVDSAYLASRTQQLGRMLDAYDGLLAGGPADSLDSYMDQAISYVAFPPTQTGFRELEQSASSKLLRNRALLADLTSAYTREYARAAEWDAINRDFVLQRMIPWLDNNAPYAEGIGGGETATGLAAVYRSVREKDQFRNLIRTNRLFKSAQQSVYGAALKRIAGIHAQITKELQRTP